MVMQVAFSFESVANLIEALMDSDVAKIDVGDMDNAKVSDLIKYLRDYPDEYVFLDASFSREALQKLFGANIDY